MERPAADGETGTTEMPAPGEVQAMQNRNTGVTAA